MQSGQASRTSILVAAARAFGARDPDPAVRNPDYLAAKLIGQAERQLISTHAMAAALDEDYARAREKPEVGSLSNTLLARTRFIDEHLERAIAKGVRQVVILGAGFDSRAYRLRELLDDCKVFEVDYAATQQFKRQRLAEVLVEIPPNLTYAEVDFQHETLGGALSRAGYQSGETTFFIWEGVCMYLHEERVRETLTFIAKSSSPGSSLVMDFPGKFLIGFLKRFPELPQHRHTTDWGEPWFFGVPDRNEGKFFGECGLELKELLPLFGRAMTDRYLTRSDKTKPGPRRPLRISVPFLRRIIILFAIANLIRKKANWYSIAELEVLPSREGAF
jgi:methyltransferase (TIGR00027 family)